MNTMTDPQVRVLGQNMASVQIVGFAADEVSQALLQKMVSKGIYQNSRLATIRELSANGLDAQIAAGRAGPIRITLPSDEDPSVSVSDAGTGMSYQEILDNFQYGASSKRGDIAATGELGLGGKSPHAVADAMTVSSVKDGLLNTIAFVSAANGLKEVMPVVVDQPTTKSNGTTVSFVPSAFEPMKWRSAARAALLWWDRDLVEVQDCPIPEPRVAYTIDENTALVLKSQDNFEGPSAGLLVTMGSVTYPVSKDDLGSLGLRFPLAEYLCLKVTVGNKDMDVLPSRENLAYTDKTRAALSEMLERVKGLLPAMVTRVLEKKTQLANVNVSIGEFLQEIGARHENITVHGHSLANTWLPAQVVARYSMRTRRTTAEISTQKGADGSRISLPDYRMKLPSSGQMHPCVFVVGADESDLAPLRRRFSTWMDTSGTYEMISDRLRRQRSRPQDCTVRIAFVDQVPPWALLAQRYDDAPAMVVVSARELAQVVPVPRKKQVEIEQEEEASSSAQDTRDAGLELKLFRDSYNLTKRNAVPFVGTPAQVQALQGSRLVVVVVSTMGKRLMEEFVRGHHMLNLDDVILLGSTPAKAVEQTTRLRELGASNVLLVNKTISTKSLNAGLVRHVWATLPVAAQKAWPWRMAMYHSLALMTFVPHIAACGSELKDRKLVERCEQISAVLNHHSDQRRYSWGQGMKPQEFPMASWLCERPLLVALNHKYDSNTLLQENKGLMHQHLVKYLNSQPGLRRDQ